MADPVDDEERRAPDSAPTLTRVVPPSPPSSAASFVDAVAQRTSDDASSLRNHRLHTTDADSSFGSRTSSSLDVLDALAGQHAFVDEFGFFSERRPQARLMLLNNPNSASATRRALQTLVPVPTSDAVVPTGGDSIASSGGSEPQVHVSRFATTGNALVRHAEATTDDSRRIDRREGGRRGSYHHGEGDDLRGPSRPETATLENGSRPVDQASTMSHGVYLTTMAVASASVDATGGPSPSHSTTSALVPPHVPSVLRDSTLSLPTPVSPPGALRPSFSPASSYSQEEGSPSSPRPSLSRSPSVDAMTTAAARSSAAHSYASSYLDVVHHPHRPQHPHEHGLSLSSSPLSDPAAPSSSSARGTEPSTIVRKPSTASSTASAGSSSLFMIPAGITDAFPSPPLSPPASAMSMSMGTMAMTQMAHMGSMFTANGNVREDEQTRRHEHEPLEEEFDPYRASSLVGIRPFPLPDSPSATEPLSNSTTVLPRVQTTFTPPTPPRARASTVSVTTTTTTSSPKSTPSVAIGSSHVDARASETTSQLRSRPRGTEEQEQHRSTLSSSSSSSSSFASHGSSFASSATGNKSNSTTSSSSSKGLVMKGLGRSSSTSGKRKAAFSRFVQKASTFVTGGGVGSTDSSNGAVPPDQPARPDDQSANSTMPPVPVKEKVVEILPVVHDQGEAENDEEADIARIQARFKEEDDGAVARSSVPAAAATALSKHAREPVFNGDRNRNRQWHAAKPSEAQSTTTATTTETGRSAVVNGSVTSSSSDHSGFATSTPSRTKEATRRRPQYTMISPSPSSSSSSPSSEDQQPFSSVSSGPPLPSPTRSRPTTGEGEEKGDDHWMDVSLRKRMRDRAGTYPSLKMPSPIASRDPSPSPSPSPSPLASPSPTRERGLSSPEHAPALLSPSLLSVAAAGSRTSSSSSSSTVTVIPSPANAVDTGATTDVSDDVVARDDRERERVARALWASAVSASASSASPLPTPPLSISGSDRSKELGASSSPQLPPKTLLVGIAESSSSLASKPDVSASSSSSSLNAMRASVRDKIRKLTDETPGVIEHAEAESQGDEEPSPEAHKKLARRDSLEDQMAEAMRKSSSTSTSSSSFSACKTSPTSPGLNASFTFPSVTSRKAPPAAVPPAPLVSSLSSTPPAALASPPRSPMGPRFGAGWSPEHSDALAMSASSKSHYSDVESKLQPDGEPSSDSRLASRLATSSRTESSQSLSPHALSPPRSPLASRSMIDLGLSYGRSNSASSRIPPPQPISLRPANTSLPTSRSTNELVSPVSPSPAAPQSMRNRLTSLFGGFSKSRSKPMATVQEVKDASSAFQSVPIVSTPVIDVGQRAPPPSAGVAWPVSESSRNEYTARAPQLQTKRSFTLSLFGKSRKEAGVPQVPCLVQAEPTLEVQTHPGSSSTTHAMASSSSSNALQTPEAHRKGVSAKLQKSSSPLPSRTPSVSSKRSAIRRPSLLGLRKEGSNAEIPPSPSLPHDGYPWPASPPASATLSASPTQLSFKTAGSAFPQSPPIEESLSSALGNQDAATLQSPEDDTRSISSKRSRRLSLFSLKKSKTDFSLLPPSPSLPVEYAKQSLGRSTFRTRKDSASSSFQALSEMPRSPASSSFGESGMVTAPQTPLELPEDLVSSVTPVPGPHRVPVKKDEGRSSKKRLAIVPPTYGLRSPPAPSSAQTSSSVFSAISSSGVPFATTRSKDVFMGSENSPADDDQDSVSKSSGSGPDGTSVSTLSAAPLTPPPVLSAAEAYARAIRGSMVASSDEPRLLLSSSPVDDDDDILASAVDPFDESNGKEDLGLSSLAVNTSKLPTINVTRSSFADSDEHRGSSDPAKRSLDTLASVYENESEAKDHVAALPMTSSPTPSPKHSVSEVDRRRSTSRLVSLLPRPTRGRSRTVDSPVEKSASYSYAQRALGLVDPRTDEQAEVSRLSLLTTIPTMHTNETIELNTRNIADDESRRLSEVAFL